MTTAIKTTTMAEYLKFVADSARQCRNARSPNGCTSFEELVLKHGREFTPHTTKCIRRGRMKECFKNAYHLAEVGGLTYCEGYAFNILPTLHAWCVNGDGKVYEPTWKQLGSSYYGIPFRMKFVQRTIVSRGFYGVIDNMEDGFPLLQGDIPDHHFIQPLKGKTT